jgi:hypothetical protein
MAQACIPFGMWCSSHSTAHQFGHTNGRVRVVEVNGDLVGQVGQRRVLRQMAASPRSCNGCGDKEVLLLQAQLTPSRRAVVGIQHPGDVFKLVLEHSRRAHSRPALKAPRSRCAGATAFHSRNVLTLVGAMARHHHVIGLWQPPPLPWRQTGPCHSRCSTQPPNRTGYVMSARGKLPGCAVLKPRVRVLRPAQPP